MNWPLFNKALNIILFLLVVGYVVYYFYKQPKYESGEMSQDFTATLMNADTFKLSDLKGNYVLLDFWGSWCGPCRQENPELVSLNNEFKGKNFKSAGGFEIVSVAIETKKENWQKAIKDDKLAWTQVSDLKGWKSDAAALYGVKGIPMNYLLDKDGKIIAKSLRGEDLLKKLGEVLN